MMVNTSHLSTNGTVKKKDTCLNLLNSKLFTNIINERLDMWAEKYHVYIEAQTGFRGKRVQ